jgi:hypothetical protein
MKKTTQLIAFLMIATIALTSCDSNKKSDDKEGNKKEKTSNDESKSQTSSTANSLEADALKIATLYCAYQKSIASGDTALTLKLDKEGETFTNSVFKKYANEADQKKIQDIIKAEIEKCK